MFTEIPGLMEQIRDRFAHVDTCPFEGPRIFFENAGGALTLKTVAETSAKFAAIPDNQGRDNVASAALVEIINTAKADTHRFFGSSSGQVFVGESGTELLFRLIRTAAVNGRSGTIMGSTVEHPATRSACARWADTLGMRYTQVPHDDQLGIVTPQAYAACLTDDVTVATILHTSPVTGMSNDVKGIAAVIRAKAPGAIIIVDGIQHASHGSIDIDSYDIDGYVISPYKVFSRHGYGIAWVSNRLQTLPHENLVGGPDLAWEFGTRDTASYATFSDVVAYLDWLGGEVSNETDPRARLEAAGHAIKAHEAALTNAMLMGTGNQRGLSEMPGVQIIGGFDNPAREGLVSIVIDHLPAEKVVESLNAQGVRTHIRRPDHYSGNILDPLGFEACTRVSLCHYNTKQEVSRFLAAVDELCISAE